MSARAVGPVGAAPTASRNEKGAIQMKANLTKEPRASHARPVEPIVPEVNIFESGEGYVIEAEMPGVTREGLDLTLEGHEITIVGRRNAVTFPGDVLLRESRDADYRRVFELDPAVDTARISAKIEQGLLTLTLPRSEKVKPRQITVN